MYVIGLTGGIGSGKTTVAKLLQDWGAAILSADLVGHEVYQPGRPAWREIVDAFGRELIAEDGTIDRKKLGAVVFSEPEHVKRLNAVVHPRMKELMREKLAELARQGTDIAVLEAAILFEAGWQDLADEVWALVLPPEVAAERTAARSGIPIEQVLERIRAQMTNAERAARADLTVDTSGTLADTERRTREAWDALWKRLKGAA